jgi:hypothetical protein
MSLQYGIKEVLDCQILDYTTGAPKLFIDYAEATTTDVAGERLIITGGQGNFRQLAFDHTKTSTLKLTVPLVDLNLLALISGDTLSTAAQNIYIREVVTVSGGAATLSQTPLAGTTPSLFFLQGTRDNGTALTKVASAPAAGQFSITGSALTFNATDNNKQVVVWYQYATPSTSTKFSVKANKFTSSVKIIGKGLARDQVTDSDVATNILFYKAKAQQNFSVTMSSTAATTLELTFDLFAEKVGPDYVYSDFVFLT